MPRIHTNFSQLTLRYFCFCFWVNKTFCSSHLRIFRFTSPSQNPKSFLSFNTQLPSSSMNAMEFQKNISVSMMHAFWYFCILYRKRFCIYSDCTFLHSFNGPGGSASISIVLFFTILMFLVYTLKNEFFLRFDYFFLSFAYAFLPFCE